MDEHVEPIRDEEPTDDPIEVTSWKRAVSRVLERELRHMAECGDGDAFSHASDRFDDQASVVADITRPPLDRAIR